MKNFRFADSEQQAIFENLRCFFRAYDPNTERYLFLMLQNFAIAENKKKTNKIKDL